MAKNSVADWSATAADNTDIGGTNIGEGCSPSGINNAIREMMAQVKALNPVGYASLSPTAEEQGQARANIGADVLGGFRNKIINGDFTVRQRGNSGSGYVTGTFTFDRWRQHVVTGLSPSYSAQTLSSGAFPFRTFGRFTFAGTGAEGSNIRQPIEGADTLAGKKVTLSVWMYLAVAGTVQLSLIQNFGTGGSPSAPSPSLSQSFEVGTSFARYDFVVDLPSVAGKTFGTNDNDYLELLIIVREPNTQTLNVAHVSLVEGDASAEADPFSPRHIQQELALCQRYYETGRISAVGGVAYATTAIGCQNVRFAVQKRAVPTISISNFSSIPVFTGTISPNASEDKFRAAFSGSGYTANTAYGVSFDWVADAEL